MNFIPKGLFAVLTLALSCSVFTFAEGGADLFKARCAACHGATGAGDTTMGKNLKLRDLGSADVQKHSDDELTAIISAGKGKMPRYDTKLSKQQIGELVKFIRTLKK
jgi:mono/diheme cytochrome c family protein